MLSLLPEKEQCWWYTVLVCLNRRASWNCWDCTSMLHEKCAKPAWILSLFFCTTQQRHHHKSRLIVRRWLSSLAYFFHSSTPQHRSAPKEGNIYLWEAWRRRMRREKKVFLFISFSCAASWLSQQRSNVDCGGLLKVLIALAKQHSRDMERKRETRSWELKTTRLHA